MDTSQELKTFSFFPHLPPELRLAIYRQIHILSHPSSTPRILKISYSPFLGHYISNTPPPITLSISQESREQSLLTYTYLTLGSPKPPSTSLSSNSQLRQRESHLPIPICFEKDTLYISSLSPLLTTFQHTFLFHLSTSPSRHHLNSLAIDLRVWNELCENGFLSVLAKMRNLREVLLVVEFGRSFKGELGWLEAPEWRRDLRWVAERAESEVGRVRQGVRKRGRGCRSWNVKGEGKGEMGEVEVRCVILTRGGEQA